MNFNLQPREVRDSKHISFIPVSRFQARLSSKKHIITSICISTFLAACTTVKPEPFQAFSQSIQQLKLGTDKALEANASMSSARFLREALRTSGAGDPKRVEQLRFQLDETKPLSIKMESIPLFMKAERFRTAATRTVGVVSTYADLLVRLSSPELLPRETFDKLATDLNANAYDAALSLGNRIPDTQKVALFSTIAVALTREYLESKRRNKLIDALTNNQGSIETFAQYMREGVLIAALHSNQEYEEESQELLLTTITRQGPAPEPDRRRAIQGLIELDTKYLDQLSVLQALHETFGRIPAAHAELIKATENPALNLATIVSILEEGKRLEAIYDKSLAVNKVKAAQAIADRASAMADKLDAEAQVAQLRADRARTEAEKAKNISDADPSDVKKKTLTNDLQELGEKLKKESEDKKKQAADARQSAVEAQKQADEAKKTLSS